MIIIPLLEDRGFVSTAEGSKQETVIKLQSSKSDDVDITAEWQDHSFLSGDGDRLVVEGCEIMFLLLQAMEKEEVEGLGLKTNCQSSQKFQDDPK